MPEDPRQARVRSRTERAPAAPPQPQIQSAPASPVDEGGSAVLDLLASPLRGAEEFGRDLLELPTILPGVDYSLGEGRIFGQATTSAGRFATGIFEFAAAFVPGAGIAGRVSRANRTFNVSKAGARAARIAGKPIRALAIEAGQGAAGGAVADFVTFRGNEDRLSNLLNESLPALRNPVTDFLAADKDDAEVVGRIKNVLEGAALGFLADTLLIGLRGVKAQRAGHKLDEAVPGLEARQTFDEAQDTVHRPLDAPPVVPTEGAPTVPTDPFELSRTEKGRKSIIQGLWRVGPDKLKRGIEDFRKRLTAGPKAFFGGGQTFSGSGSVRGTLADPRVNPRAMSDDMQGFLGLDAESLNLAATVGKEGPGHMVRTVEAMFGAGDPKAARLPVVGDAEFTSDAIAALADIVDGDPELLGVRFARAAKDNATAAKQVGRVSLALRHLSDMHAEEMVRVVTEGDLDDPAVLAALMARTEEMGVATAYMRDGAAEQGRGLRGNRILAQGSDRADIAKALANAGGAEQVRRTAEMLKMAMADGGLSGAAAVARLSSLTTKQKFWAVSTEFWLNSILSGPRTMMTNFISPGFTSFYRPLENMLGGAATLNGGAIRQGAQEILGLADSFRESFTLARKVWRDMGEQVLDPRQTVRDDPFAHGMGAIRAETLGMDPDSAIGSFTTWMGERVRTPSRILSSTDEWVKQMNYRGVSRARLLDEATTSGLSGTKAAAFVVDGMAKLTEDGQRYSLDTVTERAVKQAASEGIVDKVAHAKRVSEIVGTEYDPNLSAIADDAITRAREVTFTEDLASGSLSAKLQSAVNEHPFLRFVVPFIRTPVNIVKFAGNRLPNPMGITEAALNRKMPADSAALEGLRTQFAKDVLSGDPKKVAEAVGRQSAGMGAIMFFGTMASQGKVTGRGPSDKEQREALLGAGWQPYSFQIGDKFVSYQRMDPFATMIGTVADLYDYARLSPVDEQDNISTSVMGLAFAVANNFTNKTYLQGIGDVVDALSDPEANLPRVLAQYVASGVPSALAQGVEVAGDPHLREVNGIMDRIRSRTPFMSDKLPPMRNLFGEKISRPRGFALGLENVPGVAGDIMSMVSPITYRDVNDSKVNVELVRLQHGFSPPVPSRDGVDLMDIVNGRGQPAYDRWLELHGEIRLGGRTMKQELRKLIASPVYQALTPVSTSTTESPRVAAIGNVIRTFRGAAFDQMLNEFPQVGRAIDHASRTRRAFLAGQGEETTRLGFRTLPLAQPVNSAIGGLGG